MDSTTGHLRNLSRNIRIGIRCVFFRPVDLSRLVVDVDQLVLLILLDAALMFFGSLLVALPNPQFYPFGVPVEAMGIALALLGAVLAARIIGLPDRLLTVCVLLFSASPVLTVVSYALSIVQTQGLPDPSAPVVGAFGTFGMLGVLYVLWALAVLLRLLALLQGRYSRRVFTGLVALVLLADLPMLYFAPYGQMWFAAVNDEAPDETWAAYRALNAEDLMYTQRSRLESALSALQPGVPGRTDLYFLGFAGYARENVFRNEVTLAQKIFDTRFGTAHRSLLLVNHLDSVQDAPLATSTNLRLALRHLGRIMDRDEDVLVLFLTSHGSPAHELSVDFWPLPLNDITPAMLKSYLDEAGIRWRAVMVSSCYSGGFVPPLQDDHSLIATAAAADRTSFGCGRNRELTYFGEAFLRDRLGHGDSMVGSLQAAIEAIGVRESKEKREPSHPQLYVGEAMKTKLMQLEETLRPGDCMPQVIAC